MNISLHPIRTKGLSEQVYEQLKELIYRGKFKPGEKLPAERELAHTLGVSRPTVKSAINKLVNNGLVEQKQGQGSFVSSYQSQYRDNPLREIFDAQNVSLVDLLEVRSGLEVTAASLAAQRATPEDIEVMQDCLQEMQAKIKNGEVGADEDVSFHMNIAYATKNSAQIYLMKHFYDLLFYGIKQSQFYLIESGNLEKMGEHHSKILECIRKKDVQGSKRAMQRHIHYVREFCRSQDL